MMSRSQKYKILIQWDEQKKEFLGRAPELGDCLVRAMTQQETLELVNAAIERHLLALEQQHHHVPPPLSEKHFSGKILLRMDPLLHRDLAIQASLEELPLAHYIETMLRGK